jgi:hypothetical protein
MSHEPNESLEEALRTSAASARRAPPGDLRLRVVAQIDSNARRSVSGESAAHARSHAWRSRAQDVLAAAAVVIAIGVWGFAFLRPLPKGAPPSTAATGSTALQERTATGMGSAAEPILAAALATPRTLRTAIDESLFAELGKIATDASRAAHFLVGCVPAPLVTRASDQGAR